MSLPPPRLAAALDTARRTLLAARNPAGHWEGELSSSALSTATAVCALSLWRQHTAPKLPGVPAPERLDHAITHGLRWLAEHTNPDGGWGDTILSFSNISTTALCWAAFGAVPGADAKYADVVRRAEAWLGEKCLVISNKCLVPKPSTSPSPPASPAPAPTNHLSLITNYFPSLDRSALIRAIIARYGKDRTFSVPILTMCALAGRLGAGRDAWEKVIQLPFELAALPQKFFAALRLPVVSYALPALIAIGQVRHFHRPSRNPLLRLLRDRARAKTLRVLERIQPPNGGFLEATPLTSFVTMSLAGSGQADHPVARRGVEFLLQSVRADGSWPIDTNLATWVTTLAINALGPSIHQMMSAAERQRLLDWLLAQQYRTVHPYTNAPPGGWAWTDLPGGVPDADDTAGALLALKNLCSRRREEADCGGDAPREIRLLTSAATDPRVREAAIAGVTWLLNLQNRDGGIPTFCRGWTNLPFDRSSPDITAHALRAWLAWRGVLPAGLQKRTNVAIRRALKFLGASQLPAWDWEPLWFGNQHAWNETNSTYGTAKVVLAVNELDRHEFGAVLPMADSTGVVLLALQHKDGGWGGCYGGPVSVEETALAVEALATVANAWPHPPPGRNPVGFAQVQNGTRWLMERVEDGTWTQPAPIGFYFAKLWYYERLYPMVFTVAALEAVARLKYPTEK